MKKFYRTVRIEWTQSLADRGSGSGDQLISLRVPPQISFFSHLSSQFLNLNGRRGTTDDVATIHFHLCLSFAAFRDSPNPIPVHSLMLFSHLFFCLPLLLAPFIVPCRAVFAMPEDLEMWPYHLNFRSFTTGWSSCTLIAFWNLLRTSSFVTWFCRKCSELFYSRHLISRSGILLSSSAVKVQLSGG